MRSAPSSEERDSVEESGCMKGVLIEIEQSYIIRETVGGVSSRGRSGGVRFNTMGGYKGGEKCAGF